MSNRLTLAELEAVTAGLTEYLAVEAENPPKELYRLIESALVKLEAQLSRRYSR